MEKVLYFVSNTDEDYYDLHTQLKNHYQHIDDINVEECNAYLESIDQKFYIKDQTYQLELYNVANEYVFCINK